MQEEFTEQELIKIKSLGVEARPDLEVTKLGYGILSESLPLNNYLREDYLDLSYMRTGKRKTSRLGLIDKAQAINEQKLVDANAWIAAAKRARAHELNKELGLL